MNIYSIYTKGRYEDNDPIVIKQGFSLVAAVFNVLWALYHRLWLFAVIAVFINVVPRFFNGYHLYDEFVIVERVATAMIYGFMGAEMREYTARSRGYELSDIIAANSDAEAELKYFERSSKRGDKFTQDKFVHDKFV